jgi:hypothetical protein
MLGITQLAVTACAAPPPLSLRSVSQDSVALSGVLQRSLAVCAMAAVPISLLWWHAEPALLALGQPADIAAGAARYLQLTLPALYSYMLWDCIDKHLLAQGVATPGVVITAVSTALTPLYCMWFVNHLHLGLDGAAYAYDCVQATNALLSGGYLLWRSKALAGTPGGVSLAPSAAALSALSPYLALALPAVLMQCAEGWATEVRAGRGRAVDSPRAQLRRRRLGRQCVGVRAGVRSRTRRPPCEPRAGGRLLTLSRPVPPRPGPGGRRCSSSCRAACPRPRRPWA